MRILKIAQSLVQLYRGGFSVKRLKKDKSQPSGDVKYKEVDERWV
jgi:hypothetical protein